MRRKMQETGALLGGEFSGHLFIKERWYGFDDAIYAAVRVLEIMALEAQPLSQILAGLPSSPSTPEYQLLLEEGQSRDIMRALDAHKVFDDARLVELDGLRVEFTNGWGLIRPSNTVPSLTFRFEADDEGALEQIKSQFRDLLRRIAPDLQAPF
jgi:phosphomannomutase/phosphoglucomutase